MAKLKRRIKPQHGGARARAGRHPKEDKGVLIQCRLRKDTVELLRDQGRRRLIGPYLQWLLDRHPLPSPEEYEAFLAHKPVVIQLRNRRKVPMVISAGTRPKRKHKLPSPEVERFLEAYDSIDGNLS